VGLAGGPGQAALPLSTVFAELLAPAITARDLLLFDQRGTGQSGALACPSLERAAPVLTVTRRCAEELGPARGDYRTSDGVQDLEAIRVASGYDRLVLFGVSYGTKVALAYAAAYPDRVESLVLDSVVLPEGPDPFNRASLIASLRIENDECADGACARATPDPVGDLASFVARLRRAPLRGGVVGADGTRQPAKLSETGFFETVLAGDANPTLRSEMPGAVHAALRGDPSPILRLSVRGAGLIRGAQTTSGENAALFLATTCEETQFPWTRDAPTDQRLREAKAAARALPQAALGPFSWRVALGGGVIPDCVAWPNASPPPDPPGPLPAVRTLVISGRLDDRTPLEDAQQIPTRVGGAELVDVPYVGHSVLTTDLSGCARQAVATFFAGRPAAPCRAARNPFPPSPRPPLSLDTVRPVPPGGKAGRTLAAVRDTITDAQRQIIGVAITRGRLPGRVGGLRAGTVSTNGRVLRLMGYEYVPGVTVTGRLDVAGGGSIAVRGRAAARGRLRIGTRGTVRGTLDGRRIAARIDASAGVTQLPSLAAVLALPHLR
jgi:pimeloyl-ACP methyl ester carboxylesterase